MGKLTNYILVGSGLMLLFYLGGISNSNPLLDLVLQPENLTTSGLWITILAVIAAGGGIVIGFFARNAELVTMSVFMPYMILLLWNIINVFLKVASHNRPLAVIVFGPLLLLFIATAIEYWRGRD